MAGTREPERIIGRYALFDQIGAGGMATVHFGRLLGPAGFARTVAIKRLHPHFARDPEFAAMFLDEARLAARVQHPNVVATLDVVARDGELFLVMDFVEGLSLAGVFWESAREQRPIPIGILGAIMVNVLSGLHAAHEATNEQGQKLSLIHRDVSPQNVLVGRDGVARVLDFGIAKAIGRSQTTREGRIKGKLAYMPPEQIKAQPLDRRADIYAASVMLWELLTMRRLFDEQDDAATIWRAVHEDPPIPSSIVSGLPVGVDDLVMRGLAKNPEDRFGTAREMAIAIEKLLGAESTLSVSDFVSTCGKEALEKMASKVREIESISEELHTSDIIPDEPVRRPGRRRNSPEPEDAATLMFQGALPELPALDVPDEPVRSPLPASQPISQAPLSNPASLAGTGQRATREYGAGLPVTGGTMVTQQPNVRQRAVTDGGTLMQNTPQGGVPSFSHPELPALEANSPSRAPLSVPSYPPLTSLAPLPSTNPASMGPLPSRQAGGSLSPLPSRATGGSLSPLPSRATGRSLSPLPGLPSPGMTTPSRGVSEASGANEYGSVHHTPGGGVAMGGGMRMDLADMPAPPPSTPSPMPGRSNFNAPRYAPTQQPLRAHSAPAGNASLIGAVIFAMCLLGAGGYYMFGRPKPVSTQSPRQRGAVPPGGVERACEATRQQMQNGADIGPVDTHGWVVELWLAREDGSPLTVSDPTIAHWRASDGGLDPSVGLALPSYDRGEVSITELPSPPPDTGKEPGVVIQLGGGYAPAFFTSETRPAFLKLADRVFDESKASIGALYARCAHLPSHDVGVWFRGRDTQTAADAIGFQMSGYGNPSWVARTVFSPIGKDGTSLEAYRRKRVPLDSGQFASEVRSLDGSEEESDQKGTTVIFPLGNPLRGVTMAKWVTKQSNLD